ncbi:alpha/beta fold hydrolase [Roseibium sp.]|uniref:alpha/beta fold hydrolase n=1 Tax=Roseibium sp. TaxID=1936156 RepID=UPI003A971172
MDLFLISLAMILLGLAAYTFWKTRAIARRHSPDGEFRTVDGVKLHFFNVIASASAAPRPTLVFVHGASGNALDQLTAFKDRLEGKYGLLFVDRPGLGHSQRDGERHSNPAEQARSIGALLKDLGISDCIVIGHSLGASVTAALALLRPDLVRGLVFLAPATHPWPGGVNWYYRVAALPVIGPLFCRTITLPVAERVAPVSISGVFSPDCAHDGYARDIKLPLLFRPESFRANAQDVAYLKGHLRRLAEAYPAIEQPAVVITGDRDTVVWPSIHSEGLVRDLPNATLVVLEGAGHMPHHTHGERIAQEIMDFAEMVSAMAEEAGELADGQTLVDVPTN